MCDHNNLHAQAVATSKEPSATGDSTTNGAPSKAIFDEVVQWIMLIAEHGRIPISRLDNLVPHAGSDLFVEDCRAAFASADICDPEVVDHLIQCVIARSQADYMSYARYVKFLVHAQDSPFCLSTVKQSMLPPPTVHVPHTMMESAGDAVRGSHRAQAANRATQLIRQYQLWTFDSSSDAHRYLEWKFEVLDVCNLADEDPTVRLEILLNSLSLNVNAEVRMNLREEFSLNGNSKVLFNRIVKYLDSAYDNLRAVRHVEGCYLKCQMKPSESLSSYVSRFQKSSRLYELARDSALTDADKIVAFGAGLSPRYSALATFLETTSGSPTFLEYTQKLLYLVSSNIGVVDRSAALNVGSTTECNAMEQDRKRPRPYDSRRSRQFGATGCFRCLLGDHRAVECPNEIKDFERRCKKCGGRHPSEACRRTLTGPCRRCQQSGHMESICPNPLRTVSKGPNKSVFNHLQNAVIIVNSCSMDTELIDCEPAPTMTVKIGDELHEALLDTGAAACFCDANLVFGLLKAKQIPKSAVEKIDPVQIKFGNNQVFESDGKISLTINGHSTSFILVPDLNPQVIIGRPLLRRLQLCSSTIFKATDIDQSELENAIVNQSEIKIDTELNPSDIAIPTVNQSDFAFATVNQRDTHRVADVNPPWIEEVHDADRNRMVIQVRFPILERVMMYPHRENYRNYSAKQEATILERLLDMSKDGRVTEASLESIRVLVPIVLVDKYANSPAPDIETNRRFRITLDLRGYNRLRLVDLGHQQGCVWMARDLASIKKHEHQSQAGDRGQPSVTRILRRIPADKSFFFTKIDLSDAYNSVYLHPAMRHVGSTVFDAATNRYRYFIFNTLPQGWTHAPSIFRMCSNYIVEKCRLRLCAISLDKQIYIDSYQDDLILCAGKAHKDDLITATNVVIDTLLELSFSVRREKIAIATTSIIFCGYKLSAGKSIPHPTRSEFSREIAAKMWDSFISMFPRDVDGVVSWIRSFCGRMQYLSSCLGPKELKALQSLYKFSASAASSENISIPDFRASFDILVDYVCNGLPGLYLGSFGPEQAICSVIIADANMDSWAAILVKVVRSKDHQVDTDSLFTSLLELLSKEGIDCNEAVTLPVRVFGGRFNKTESRQSSTFRERVAILHAISEAEPLLEGRTIVISDNRNCHQEWRDIDSLSGPLLHQWSRYCQTIDLTLWMAREGIPKLADILARQISRDLPVELSPTIKNSNAHLKSVTIENSNVALNSVTSVPTIENSNAARSVTTIELTPSRLVECIKSGYQSDMTKYHDIHLSEIYAALTSGGTIDPSSTVGKASQAFSIDAENLMWFLSKDKPRLYVPNIKAYGVNIRGFFISRGHGPSHFGRDRTIYHCSDYWWPSLNRDVDAFVSSCWDCIRFKSHLVKGHQSSFQSSTSKSATRPFQAWFVDHFGPLSEVSGPKYGLVCVCGFSHYVISVGVESIDATTTAIELFKIFSLFGIPSFIHSDRGSAFTSELDKQLCELLRIDRQFSPVAFPRSNGVTERAVGTVKSMLSTVNPTNLIVALPLICLLHNSTPNHHLSSTATVPLTPFEGAFGFTARSISEMDLGLMCTQPFSAEIQFFARRFYRQMMSEYLTNVDNESRINSRFIGFAPGDLVVIIRKHAVTSSSVDGPFVLLSRLGSNIWRMYRLEEGLMVSVTEAPEALLKKFQVHPIIEGFPNRPPIPERNPAVLKRHDFVIVKNTVVPSDALSIPSVSLHQVMSNDIATEKITAKLWSPNRLMEFFATDSLSIIPWDRIVLSNFKLSNRMLSESIQKIVFSLLREGL